MNQEQIAERLQAAKGDKIYKGELTSYALNSIESGKSSYPVANLLLYCKGYNIRLIMLDMATEERFYPSSVLEVHKTLDLLMNRYDVDYKFVYRKTAVHYTAPKSFDMTELDRIAKESGKRFMTPLSIKTLLAVCEVIHCDLLFEPIDESSV